MTFADALRQRLRNLRDEYGQRAHQTKVAAARAGFHTAARMADDAARMRHLGDDGLQLAIEAVERHADFAAFLAGEVLADEYDAAQARGEVATVGKRSQPERLVEAPPSAADIGISRKTIHEARQIRDAEEVPPTAFSSRELAARHKMTERNARKRIANRYGREPGFYRNKRGWWFAELDAFASSA